MKGLLSIPVLCLLLSACSGQANKTEQKAADSLELAEDKQVEAILKNEDSLMKAKEQELLKQYGR